MSRGTAGMRSSVIMAIGGAIGALWVAMAASALWSSFRGFQNQRLDWGLGWGLVGVLLLAAGVAAVVGTWWHVYRIGQRQ
ncbi:MAG: hypothetical protein HY703_03865 [Gemmatimonadetes bacterium]|nr:hypothetical protein [Gemmatimonadota bacterium]